ncbi:RNA-directed DNA polymerase (reverse transcriptase) [Raphanus sativus]|uniref:Nuclear intron maturase 3, mitochondrial n=1 Tax=Raphanus sativus TaxID=3726 RepID=A0A6J0K2W4_RAPSA|nr:nuclear intron maturase 3, mitochondrial [Raphanus sativus]KAJ4882391.1 RNA-directed DNA polymerase (reverse transcriptase) [Raphanus sativus]
MVLQLRVPSLYNRGISFLISSPLRNLSTASLLLNPNQTVTEPLAKPELESIVLKQYSHGKFHSLLQNAVALPSVLLAACHNLSLAANTELADRVSRRFSIEETAREIREGRFDIRSCCVGFESSSLVLPNLKLRVLIEAIRMVLEIVYDDRLATFCYGGRVGMGRHTAIRYLKNSVENPRWWFRVSFAREMTFGHRNVDKLCRFVEEKISDGLLVEMIKKLFEFGIVRIELGGCDKGRGFPQECGLSSILINVYFDGLDKEIQDMRLKMKLKNPPRVGAEEDDDSVFYKPVNIYAVRYLDEILLITSGSKMMTMELKKKVVEVLEERLDLKVDRVNTSIHSAVSEKISFLGMYLQAVPPSVLRPPMSEKAVRAMKKYERQKEVRRVELRNARERNRKTLGLKIFRHVLKKLKQSNGFKCEYEIENEVRDIFRSWGEEVMQEFMGSLEERWKWHWLLTRGDFLSLRHIREKLPQDLVNAYDEFQEQVDKHLSPTQAKKELEDEEKRVEEEEEQRYAERTVQDLTKLCMKVSAPEELVRKAVKLVGFTNSMGRPRPISHLLALEDSDIIKWYAGVGRKWLDFFCCCHNFKMVKIIVSYHMRFSCILTLAEKHRSSKREAIRHYTKDLKVSDHYEKEEVHFPLEREVKMMGDKNLSDPRPVDGTLSLLLIRLASDEPLHSCAANFCDRTDTIMYRVHLLQNRLQINPLDEEKWVRGMGTIHSALNRKCLHLCSAHISDVYLGNMTLQDVDGSSFIDLK